MPSEEEVNRRAKEAFLTEKSQLLETAQAAADQELIGNPVCLDIGVEGEIYSIEDTNVLPKLRIWRFLETERIAIRQVFDREKKWKARFFIAESYRDAYDDGKYCFGKWAVVGLAFLVDGREEVKMGVDMRPYDIKLRLVKIHSKRWLESKIVKKHLVGPLTELTEDVTVRAYLPKRIEQLPPKDSKPLQF